MTTTRLAAAIVGAWLLFSATAFAQDPPTEAAAASPEEVTVSWSIPDSPAASAIDVSRGDASPPTIARMLSYELLNVDGEVGFAGEFSPYLAYLRLHDDGVLSLEEYQNDWGVRALAQLSVSAAAVPTEEDGARAALAIRWTPWNLNDPYLNTAFQECLVTAVAETMTPVDTSEPAPSPGEVRSGGAVSHQPPSEERQRRMKKCADDEAADIWNATALQVSAVQLWHSEDDFNEFESAGVRYAAVLSYGFDGWAKLHENSQLLISVSHGDGVDVVDDNDNIVERDETTVGVRLRIAPPFGVGGCEAGNGRCFNVYGEAEYSQNDYATGQDEEEWSYSLGAEWEVRENLWLGFSVQDRSSDAVTGDETRAGMQIRFAFNDKAQFARD